MSSSNPTATVCNNTAQALYQLERIMKAFEEEIMSANILSSPEEDSLAYIDDIHDSLTLKQYATLKLDRDDFSDGDQLDIDISQQEGDRAWEAFDSSWEHDLAPSRPSTSSKRRRRGVRRGQHQDSAEAPIPAVLTVMTKTYDG